MVTLGVALVLAAAIYAGLTWRLASRPAFFAGVAITLALWAAAVWLPPSYSNVLWLLLGLVGSLVFGLTGLLAWWRVRAAGGTTQWPWLGGSALAVAPVILFVFRYLLHW